MPAAYADIAAASRDAVVATWSDAAIAARYPGAIDGTVQPAEGFFDSVADAQAVIDARAQLIGRERRRFAVDVADLIWPELPMQARLVDAEQRIDGGVGIARIEVDLESGTTSLETFG